MKKRAFMGTLLALAAASGARASDNNYPSKPIRFIVPFGPGGGTDIVARLIATYMSARLGQPVVVENRAGAGGAIGSNIVAKSAPDGYSILLAESGRTIGPYMQKDLPFDFAKDFDPIGLMAGTPLLLLANPDAPVKTFDELITYAKANPGKLTYGSSGTGTPQHFAVELLKATAGMDLVHVPYKGAVAAIADAVGGQIQLVSATYAPASEFIRNHRLRPLVVMEPKRLPALPDVPTAAERYPDVILSIWFGIMVPTGVDPAVRNKLSTVLRESVADPDYVEKIHTAGLDIATDSPEQLRARIQRELKLFGEVARKAGIKPE